jgi:U3 small nucleolar RNA-associated protein 15
VSRGGSKRSGASLIIVSTLFELVRRLSKDLVRACALKKRLANLTFLVRAYVYSVCPTIRKALSHSHSFEFGAPLLSWGTSIIASSRQHTIHHTAHTMGDYKTSVSLQTQVPSVSSVTLGLAGTSDPSEARFWTQKFGLGTTYAAFVPNKYAHPNSLKFKAYSNAIVNQVLFGPPAFSKISPLAVVSGPRVSLYTGPAFGRSLKRNSTTEQQVTPDRNVVTGGHPALCAAYRQDGRLLAIGTDAGDVRICDATSRATLATFRSTSLAVRTVSWLRNGKQVLSGGDDGVLRLWNLNKSVGASNADGDRSTLALKGHADAIRCALVWQPRTTSTTSDWKELAISGSYDHTIRIWNMEQGDDVDESTRCTSVLQHGAPVEALLLQPNADSQNSPPWLISAGGTTIKVWNPLTGKCVCTCKTQHSKTITSLVAMVRTKDGDNVNEHEDASAWRILTGGLDGLVRIHTWNNETGQVKHIHGVKLADPITSMAVNETYNRLVIGTSTGYVLVKERSKSIPQSKRRREPRAGTYAYFTRGMNVLADAGNDFVAVQESKKQKVSTFDLALRQFRYGDALDDALNTRQPTFVVAVLEELGKRRGLTIALSNRDEETLEPILSFTVRYITRPQFSSLLIGVAHKLCDIYGNVAGQSETIDELFEKLRTQVSNECRVQKSLLRIAGQLDAIMTMAEMEQEVE